MSDVSPILSLPLIQPAQAQKHVTHNEALRLLDLLVQPVVSSRGQNVPPATPVEGERHIVGAAPTGAWAGQPLAIAVLEAGLWQFLTPRPGWAAHVLAEDDLVQFVDGAWQGSADRNLRVASLGVNAAPDAFNRLTVAGAATLLTHAGAGGHQLKLNKAAAGDTAGLLFQTGFSGRAEIGTAGTDSLAVRVSADGTTFRDGLRVAAATGIASLPQGARLPDGTVAAPALAFEADADTGLARTGADQLALVAGGASRLVVSPTAVQTTVAVLAPAGTATAASLGFSADADTGLFNAAANQLGITTGGVRRVLLTTAAMQVDVPVTGTAVTQSGLDTTAGRLLKVGDFGLGLTPPATADLTAMSNITGWYTFNAAATNKPGPSTTEGNLFHQRFNVNSYSQMAVVMAPSGASRSRVYHRNSNGVDLSPWVELYGQNSALGTVSHDGTNNTGALIESGAGANGEFRRFACGLQICWRANLSAPNASAALGALFRSADVVWTFPVAFAVGTSPVVTGDADDPDAWVSTGAPGNVSGVVRVLSAVSKGGALAFRAMAVGRWRV